MGAMIWDGCNIGKRLKAHSKARPQNKSLPGVVQDPLLVTSALTIASWTSVNSIRLSHDSYPRTQSKLHNVYTTALLVHNTHRTQPASEQHIPTLRRICHSFSAGLPPQRPIKLKLRDRLCISIRRGHSLIMCGFPYQICRLTNKTTRLGIGAKIQVFQILCIPSQRTAGRRCDNPLHTQKAGD